ncbi:MAG: hypothetical protein MI741_15295 [Rhodospirillales bacterium]|nr:hypothetical protein [Rhodospirillales bacterium]
MTSATTTPGDQGADHESHGHHDNPYLAHHFDTPEQQMASGKLGMWAFLATEILMFGGLFCAYAIYRGNHPEIFIFAHHYLDKWLGAINTVILLASSFTMAWAVRAAQLNQKKLLPVLLALTLLGGAGFMIIKAKEYASKWDHGGYSLWVGATNAFYTQGGDPTNPEALEKATHPYHEGEHDEKHDATGNKEHAEEHTELSSPDSEETGELTMSATGESSPANRALAEGEATDPAVEAVAAQQQDADTMAGAWPPKPVERSVVDVSTQATAGTSEDFLTSLDTGRADKGVSLHAIPDYADLSPIEQERAHLFFQIYYMMTGLHGIHVLIGLGIIAWLLYRSLGTMGRALVIPTLIIAIGAYLMFISTLADTTAMTISLWTGIVLIVLALAWGVMRYLGARARPVGEGDFNDQNYATVDISGLYWHLVDLIWIFLFPLLYLIH